MSKSHKIKTNLFGKDRNGDNEKKHVEAKSQPGRQMSTDFGETCNPK